MTKWLLVAQFKGNGDYVFIGPFPNQLLTEEYYRESLYPSGDYRMGFAVKLISPGLCDDEKASWDQVPEELREIVIESLTKEALEMTDQELGFLMFESMCKQELAELVQELSEHISKKGPTLH